jgi:hypothetical protein
MARPINPKCLECSAYSVEWARVEHGPNGDDCWVEEENRCEKLRWQYQNRAEQNAKRRLEYRLRQQAKQTVAQVSFPVAQRPTPIRIIFSEEPDNFKKNVTLVHAIEFQLWVGTECYTKREPIACWGMRGDEVAKLMEEILTEFTVQYSATLNQGKPFKKFVTIHKHIRECRINNPWSIQHG